MNIEEIKKMENLIKKLDCYKVKKEEMKIIIKGKVKAIILIEPKVFTNYYVNIFFLYLDFYTSSIFIYDF